MGLYNSKKFYSLEGNIGSGKTSLLTKLNSYDNIEIILEPLDEWKKVCDEEGNNLFELYYKNPKKYGILFQSLVYKTRLKSIDKPQIQQNRITERCVMTDKHVFMNVMIQNNIINKLENEWYHTWYDWITSKFPKPDKIIYLRTSVDICMERIKKRAREGEQVIDISLLTQLHHAHDAWLLAQDNVIIINGDFQLDIVTDDVLSALNI